MAITKTTTVQRVEVYEDTRLLVVYADTFDDPDDDQLPFTSHRTVFLNRTTSTMDDEGNVTETETDVSNHDALVQTIAAAVWA